jgi:putative flavoprotein involved in K+ transport
MITQQSRQALAGVLEQFEGTLRAGDVQLATSLFQPDGFWRDLVLFTWNIKTMEGRSQIGAMLDAQLAMLGPISIGLADNDEVSEAGGVLQGWISIDTGVGRGIGFIRVKEGKIWTLLTTMSELKGRARCRVAGARL